MAAAPFTTCVDGRTGTRRPALGSTVPRLSDLSSGCAGLDRDIGHVRMPKGGLPAELSSLNRSPGDVAPRVFGPMAWHQSWSEAFRCFPWSAFLPVCGA
jgi:hypothetical protein